MSIEIECPTCGALCVMKPGGEYEAVTSAPPRDAAPTVVVTHYVDRLPFLASALCKLVGIDYQKITGAHVAIAGPSRVLSATEEGTGRGLVHVFILSETHPEDLPEEN